MYGLNNWEAIAKFLPGRSNLYCKQRWFYYLDPTRSTENWRDDEDLKLLDLQQKYVNKW